MIYFPTNWGAKEPQNLPNHRVVIPYQNRSFFLSDHRDFPGSPDTGLKNCRSFAE